MRARKLTFANPETIYLLYVVAMFFVAQFLYYLAHAGFFSNFKCADPIVLDSTAVAYMKDHFWKAVYYYHLSPPLYFLYAGLFKLSFPPDGELGFYVLHSLLGVYAIYSLYKVQRRLGINPVLATFLVTAFALSPSFNIAETVAYYDFPTACLVSISVWQLVKLLDQPRFSSAFIFFSTIALLCSIRSVYHVLLYMAPLILVTLFILRKHWKMILLSSLLPFLFVFSGYLKNYLLFNVFTTSSYFGETFDTVVMQFYVTLPQREEGIKKGFFSDLALCPSNGEATKSPTANSKYGGWYCYTTFANKYREAYIRELGKDYKDIPFLFCPRPASIPQERFLPPRACLGNIGMSREYERNTIQAILHYPMSFGRGLLGTFRQYFNSSISYYFEIGNNYRHLPVSMAGSWLRFPLLGTPDPRLPISLPLLFLFPLLLFFAVSYVLYSTRGIVYFLGLYLLTLIISTCAAIVFLGHLHFWPLSINFGFVQKGLMVWVMLLQVLLSLIVLLSFPFIKKRAGSLVNTDPDSNKRIIVLYSLCTIIFTTIIITCCTGISQQRYRFYIDGLYLILLGLFIQTIVLPMIGKIRRN